MRWSNAAISIRKAGSDRRERRRRANQLDGRPHRPVRGGGLAAFHRRLVTASGTRRISPCSRRPGFKGSPWENRQTSRALADHLYRQKSKRRMMLVEGESDLPHSTSGWRRDDVPGSEVPAKFRGCMVRFPGESHELSRSGRAVASRRTTHHIVNWFDMYLQGKPNTMYDLGTQQSVKAAAKK